MALWDTVRKAISVVAMWITQVVPVIILPPLPGQTVSSVFSLVRLIVAEL